MRNKNDLFDKNGVKIEAGCSVLIDGRTEKVYLSTENELCFDATRKSWIDSGKACPCEFGLYPITKSQAMQSEVILK